MNGARPPQNMAAPNAQATAQATPQPMAPSASDMPAIPPEIMALLGGGGGAPPAPAPAPAQPMPQDPGMGQDPLAGIPPEVLMQLLGGMGQQAQPDMGPSPMTAQEVGAPEMPQAPTLPSVPAFAPDFRQQFYQRNGRFPQPKDYEDDAFERDFVLRTGRAPSKREWITRAQPPQQPMGVSEWG